MRRMGSALVLAAAVAAGAGQAAAQSCAELGTVGALIEGLAEASSLDPALAGAFCADYRRMATRLTDAEIEIERLEAELAEAAAMQPPVGSVLMVDRGQGCPAGWTDVALAEPEIFAARFPVAVGVVEGRDFRGYRDVGGNERHRLTEAELPPHGHTLPFAFTRLPGEERSTSSFAPRLGSGQQVAVAARTGREVTDRTGGAQPLPTTPPYVALFFCRRD